MVMNRINTKPLVEKHLKEATFFRLWHQPSEQWESDFRDGVEYSLPHIRDFRTRDGFDKWIEQHASEFNRGKLILRELDAKMMPHFVDTDEL